MSYYYNINVTVKRFIVYEATLYDLYLFYTESRAAVEWADSWWGTPACIRMVLRLHHAVNTTVGPHVTIIPSTPENRSGKFESLHSIKNYQIRNIHEFCPGPMFPQKTRYRWIFFSHFTNCNLYKAEVSLEIRV